MEIKKKIFQQSRPSGSGLYMWSPLPNDFTNKNLRNSQNRRNNQKPFFCDAVAGSQGQDWVTTYAYDLLVVDGVLGRLAYVECGYVE